MKRMVTMVPVMGALMMAAMATVGCGQEQVVAAQATAKPDRVQRGEYLVKIMGCNDCHTPVKMGPNGPEPDMSRFLSGHPEQMGTMPPAPAAQGPWVASVAGTMTAWAGPWGVSYTANLTPDQNTGLGIWTEDMFITALRTGKHMGTSRPILPPMPWPAFRNATDEDLKSVFAYLRSIPAITNHVPDPQIAPSPVTTN
jgi:mono/diheme cytochrome c family protein